MAPSDKIFGKYPKSKPIYTETKTYDFKNVGLIKDKKGKARNLF
jgi:hypothetical protein